MRLRSLSALLCLLAAPALAAGEPALRWRAPDAAGDSAWRALLAANPDLAAEVRAARFAPAQGLRQISVDLNGDGRPEVLLHMSLRGWCGSAGCSVFVMTRAPDGTWREVCTTNAERDHPIRLHAAGDAGWRGFDATARVRFRRAADGAIVCEEEALRRRP
jgi:hypothetical protein